MKKSVLLTFLVCAVFVQKVCANQGLIVGYLPTYRFYLSSSIAYERLTHVNIAFARTDAGGNLSTAQSITGVVGDIHDGGAKALVSIGGGGLSETERGYYDNLSLPENVREFAGKVKEYLLAQGLDGLDVDLEGNAIGPNYGDLIDALADTLHEYDLLLTAALGTWGGANVPSSALERFDFINVMAYDATGPWNPSNPGQHSSYEFAQQNIDHWVEERGVPRNKIVLGVPFYGYDFGSDPVGALTYGQILAQFPDDAPAMNDQIGQLYYNGATTIEEKVKLALEIEEVAGIMIWELGQDASGGNSLLKLISEVTATVGLEEVVTEELHDIWPNPASGKVHLRLPKDFGPFYQLEVINFHGQSLFRSNARELIQTSEGVELNTSDLGEGGFVIKLLGTDRQLIFRFFQNIY